MATKTKRTLKNFKLPKDTVSRLEKMANETGRTMTKVVIEAIDGLYAKKKSA